MGGAGEAGLVWLGEDGSLHTDARVEVSENTALALRGHGVLAELEAIPLDEPLAPGRDVVIRQVQLRAALDVLYEADRKTYGGTFAFAPDGREPVAIDNREYQRGLARLIDLLNRAHREGHAVRIRL